LVFYPKAAIVIGSDNGNIGEKPKNLFEIAKVREGSIFWGLEK
jgi:hypothetical protein